MIRRSLAAVSCTAAVACATTSGSGEGRQLEGPRTRAERSGFLETSTYADVAAFLDSLAGRPQLAFGTIGKTVEGRDIPYVVASRPRVTTPEEARRLGRPVIYVQGNIHAGEVEGKEALLALLRDLTASSRTGVLDSIVLIAVPIYNADGNERFAPQEVNRPSQNGPAMIGVRANAQGLDLNRDYVKAEAPETRASLAMFDAWEPDVFVDLHTTNGSYHGYALTYAASLNPASALLGYGRDSVMPELRRRMQVRHRLAAFDYGGFITADTLSKGWVTFDSRPRYGTNYYGLRGRVGILSEAYSRDPFEKRIRATYAFAREILSLIAERGVPLAQLAPRPVPIRAEMVAAPDSQPVIAEIIERTGDSSRTEAGVPPGRRRTGRFVTVRMPVFDRFRPVQTASVPELYVLRARDTAVVSLLRAHGIEVETVSEPRQVSDAQVFVVDSSGIAPRPFQGHQEMRVFGKWRREARTIEARSYAVPTAQRLGVLAVYLLEPESDDGLVTWNFFDPDLRAGAVHPVFRVGGPAPSDSERQ